MRNKKREFASVFSKEMKDFIELKRHLGYKYDTGRHELAAIDRRLNELGVVQKTLTKEVCDKLCIRESWQTFKTQANRIGVLKDFCRYLNSLGFEAYIPVAGQRGKDPRFAPHIYTDDELTRLFKAIDTTEFMDYDFPYYRIMTPVFFRILYTSGLRLSELRLAKVKEMDLESGIITVRQAKNRKDRLVPIHRKLIGRCQRILQKAHANAVPDHYFFYSSKPTAPITDQSLRLRFKRCLEKAGIPITKKGPRIHDLRHTFCVNLLRKWTAEGKDLMAWLPYMRTILGHETFRETAYYCTRAL